MDRTALKIFAPSARGAITVEQESGSRHAGSETFVAAVSSVPAQRIAAFWANREHCLVLFGRNDIGPGLSTGAFACARSVSAAGVGAGPDEARALTVFVIEEVGVDRGGKARIVQLQAQVLAALVRFLRPGGADLGAADQNPVGGRVLTRGPQVGDEAHTLGLQAESEDFAGVFGAGLLEGADGRHVLSPFCCFGPASLRPRWRSTARRRPLAHPLHGGWTAEEELSCPARNDGVRTGRGRKLRRRCCAEALEAKTSFGQISPSPEVVGRGLGQGHNGDQGDPEGPSGKTGQAPPAMKPHVPAVMPACTSP